MRFGAVVPGTVGGGRRGDEDPRGEGWRKNGRPFAQRRIVVYPHPPSDLCALNVRTMRRLHREKNITTPGSGKTGGACAGFRACVFLCSGKAFILFSRAFILRAGLPFHSILQENGGGTADRLLSLVPFRSAGKRAGVRYSPAAIYSFPQTKAHVQRGGSISPSHLPHGSVLPAEHTS